MNRFRDYNAEGFIISKNSAPNSILFLKIYTKQDGLISAKLKSSSKLTNKFQGKLELLTKANFTIYKNGDRYSIKEINNVQNQHLDRITLTNQELISTLCKIYCELLPENQNIPHIFQILNQTHHSLTNNTKPELIAISNLSQTLNALGIMPNLKHCPTCHNQLTLISNYCHHNQVITCQKCPTGQKQDSFDTRTRKTIFYASKSSTEIFCQIQLPQNTIINSLHLLKLITANYINKTPYNFFTHFTLGTSCNF